MMSNLQLHFLLFTFAIGISSATSDAGADAPWSKPREIGDFQALLARSPFSLPTAEESSPVAERFSLTGAAVLNGEPTVFIIDRTTQNRQAITKKSKENMMLVEYLPNPDPRKIKATIRVDGQIATITFSEPSAASPQQQEALGQPGQPGQAKRAQQPNGIVAPLPTGIVSPTPSTVVNVPPPVQGSPAFQQSGGPTTPPAAQPHRVIRRRTSSGQNTPGQ